MRKTWVQAAAAVLVSATATGGVVAALAGVPALTGVPYARGAKT